MAGEKATAGDGEGLFFEDDEIGVMSGCQGAFVGKPEAGGDVGRKLRGEVENVAEE